ncbi:hypothetical protein B0H15DRAFT_949699 [Mycena belliarum]|uniref:Protein-S-isoprenylcysteine O-methyltransferase n=1 Tax=Mycena belliarum TaxID=1033014 RepID=A0AAD6U3J6_9AGAR|nr:hypothetical protein B0H15DRAFT_949699 [Mycena belliae]
MSLVRVVLVLVQAAFNELACTPPNPTPEKGRYHTDTHVLVRIAPLILRIHQLLLRLCTLFEVLVYLAALPQLAALSPSPTLWPAPPPALHPTPLFALGVLFVVLGALLRLACFRALGPLFTFALSISPSHRLVTAGPYAVVRHPAYTGSLAIVAGLAASHLTAGSWIVEALLGGGWQARCVGAGAGAVWWAWTLGIGFSRVRAEDAQMRALFSAEWDAYAARVPCWWIPGVV